MVFPDVEAVAHAERAALSPAAASTNRTVIVKLRPPDSSRPGRSPASRRVAASRAVAAAPVALLSALHGNGYIQSCRGVLAATVQGTPALGLGARGHAPMVSVPGATLGETASDRAVHWVTEAMVTTHERLSASAGLMAVLAAPGVSPADLAASLGAAGDAVEYAYVPQPRYPCARGTVDREALWRRQWGHAAVGAPLAWARPGFRDAAEVTVMVADTGVDAGHPALDSVISRYDNPLSGIEDDADRVGHGTHVAGIISAVAGPDGIRGVCAARIAAVKVLPTRSDSWDEVAYLRGLASSLDVPGVRVLNLSLGSPHRNRAEAEIIAELIAANIVVVAAMGNEYRKGNATSYPAAHPGVIAVGASDELDQRASFSNTGGHIALAAPGVNILSTLPRAPSQMGGVSGYGTASGTSMATPYVSAAAALLLEKEPGLTPAQVRERLCETCDRVGSPGGRDEQLGWGRLNLFRALA